ncbi:eukaryotic porin-domain-containing protein [Fomitopsis serialis]|uniref:eukaryotic porin-domain-containing protein n=1 Tax=Fomitopsis serialis TaxID=139415 RepID=UPI002007F28E|nr:eukaryotic porin-domain-containing protein [Neoantrodia serialis]KAH9934705.1 eukaryotic porin-domain-containing protein [Neoantrodia serialis]
MAAYPPSLNTVEPAAVSPGPSPSTSKSPAFNVFHRIASWRSSLGLPNPGTVENLQKEVKSTLLTNFFFDGARADLSKSLSVSPIFQVTHSFALGSQTAAPSYNFGAVFANNNVFLQGSVDHEGNVSGRLNQGWSANNVTKAQCQLSSQVGHSMLQAEHDYQGQDYSVNVKAMNPSPVDATGIYMASYLQSFTKNVAVGVEMLHQRPAPDMTETAASYLAKFTSTDKNWIATAQLQPAGMLQATYWQKLSEKVEVAADLQVIAAPARRDAIATLGAKAQLDSTGKVSALLEQRFAPSFAFMVSGEIDHFKNAAKVGVGVMIESPSMTPEEMNMMQMLPPRRDSPSIHYT